MIFFATSVLSIVPVNLSDPIQRNILAKAVLKLPSA
jgi:hypothetical protein